MEKTKTERKKENSEKKSKYLKYMTCLGKTFGDDNPVEVWNKQLSLLVEGFVPTKVIHVHNKDKPWFNDNGRHAFDLKQEAHHGLIIDHSQVNWEEFIYCQKRANKVYADDWTSV